MIPTASLDKALDKFHEDQESNLGVIGTVAMIFEQIRDLVKPPKVEAPSQPPAAKEEPDTSNRIRMNRVLDQHDDGSFEELDAATRANLRRRHEITCGAGPHASRRPSALQLGALHERLRKGKAPFADFALFPPSALVT